MALQLARKLLKVSLRVFGSIEENRVQAFLVVRRLALEVIILSCEMHGAQSQILSISLFLTCIMVAVDCFSIVSMIMKVRIKSADCKPNVVLRRCLIPSSSHVSRECISRTYDIANSRTPMFNKGSFSWPNVLWSFSASIRTWLMRCEYLDTVHRRMICYVMALAHLLHAKPRPTPVLTFWSVRQHAFVYIRQLAIQLRSALTCTAQKTKEAHQVCFMP